MGLITENLQAEFLNKTYFLTSLESIHVHDLIERREECNNEKKNQR